ncbi:MAG: hypothetical protein CMH80_06755 [Nitrospinae bacterium]|nr:hypothetical protein [Nitrospinota bacterium]
MDRDFPLILTTHWAPSASPARGEGTIKPPLHRRESLSERSVGGRGEGDSNKPKAFHFILLMKKVYKDAIVEYKKTIQKDPNNGQGYFSLSTAYNGLNEGRKSILCTRVRKDKRRTQRRQSPQTPARTL